MFSIDSKDFRPLICRPHHHQGLQRLRQSTVPWRHKTGVTFIRHADGWERQEYTSGDYCPYCGSFDCCGSCEEARPRQAGAPDRLRGDGRGEPLTGGRLTRQSCISLHDICPLRRAFCVGGKMENRQALRDPGYSLADRRREEEALRTAVEMMKPETVRHAPSRSAMCRRCGWSTRITTSCTWSPEPCRP